MTSLLDIAPSVIVAEQVHGVDVIGLSADAIAFLLNKFPPLRKAVSGKVVEVEAVIEGCPSAVSEIIAAATGHFNEAEHIAAAARLPIDLQIDFVAAVIRRTMPGGIDPFARKLESLGKLLNPDAAPSTTLP